MNLSEKNNHFKQLIQMKAGVGPESEWELESDNRNCPESESELESDDETSDSTALLLGLLESRVVAHYSLLLGAPLIAVAVGGPFKS